MPGTLETTIKRFIGLSTDRKPYAAPRETGEEKPPDGSTFLEADTQMIYRWLADHWWPQDLAGTAEQRGALGGHVVPKDPRETRFR